MSQAPSPARLACAGLISLAVGMGFGRFVYTPILPVMAAALHLTKAETGWIASANFAGYLAGALLAAAPGFKGSARRWMLLALFASGLTTLAMAAASTSIAFAAIRFLGGVASAFVLVFASTAVLERLARLGQPQWSALHFAGVGLGIAASAVLVAGLGAAGLDWRMLWAASGALSLLGALGQHNNKKPLPEQIAEADKTDGGKILLHILGKDNDQAVQSLASQSGLSGNQVNNALSSLAPALLSTLSSATTTAGNAGQGGKVDLSDGLDLSDVAALLGGGKVSASPFGLLAGLTGAGKANKKNEKDNSLNGNDLLSALLSFKG